MSTNHHTLLLLLLLLLFPFRKLTLDKVIVCFVSKEYLSCLFQTCGYWGMCSLEYTTLCLMWATNELGLPQQSPELAEAAATANCVPQYKKYSFDNCVHPCTHANTHTRTHVHTHMHEYFSLLQTSTISFIELNHYTE